MDRVLFVHSPNLHEAHRMFAETIDADFEGAYHREMKKGFRRFFEAFKRAKEYPDYHVYCSKEGYRCFQSILKRGKI